MTPIHLAGVGDGAVPGGLASGIERIFRAPCRVVNARVDCSAAFDAGRGQYYSTEILRRLQPLASGGARVLGVTGLDLFVPVLTFVFGEAQLEGRCALVSFHRLKEEFYGMPPRPQLLAERLLKEAVHELGHTFGLRHCFDWQCVMASSHAVELLDVKGAEFCRRCARAVYGAAAGAVP